MNSWVPALHWRYHWLCPAGHIFAEFPISSSLFPDRHCDRHEVSFDKGLNSTVRLSCDLLAPEYACVFNVRASKA